MNADSGHDERIPVIVNTGSGQAERSLVAARSRDSFAVRKVLDGSLEATDETTSRTPAIEIRRRTATPRHRTGVWRGPGEGHRVSAAGDHGVRDLAVARRHG